VKLLRLPVIAALLGCLAPVSMSAGLGVAAAERSNVATSKIPQLERLVIHAYKVSRSLKAYHLSFQETISSSGSQGVKPRTERLAVAGDAEWRGKLRAEVSGDVKGQNPLGTTSHRKGLFQLIRVGKREATSKKAGGWKCSSGEQPGLLDLPDGTSIYARPTFHRLPKSTVWTDRGLTTVDGTAARQIAFRLTESGGSIRERGSVWISRPNGTILHLAAHAKLVSKPNSIKLIGAEDFTSYGEHVKIRLPKACKPGM